MVGRAVAVQARSGPNCDLHLAAAALANLTDICSLFAICDDSNKHGCPLFVPPPPHVAARVRALYGAFREVFLPLGAAGGDGDDVAAGGEINERARLRRAKIMAEKRQERDQVLLSLLYSEIVPWAAVVRAPGCGRRIDLLIGRRTPRPLLGALADLLTYAPAGACTRVFVYESRGNQTRAGRRYRAALAAAAAASSTALDMPSADARDAILGVHRRLLLGGAADSHDLDAMLAAHRAAHVGAPAAADTTIVISDAIGLGHSARDAAIDFDYEALFAPKLGGKLEKRLSATSSRRLKLEKGRREEARHERWSRSRKWVDPWCRARGLLSHEIGPPAVTLSGGAVMLRLATSAALVRTTRASQWIREGLKWDTRDSKWSAEALKCEGPRRFTNGNLRSAHSQVRLTRALAMLLAPAAELIDASASAGPSPIAHAQRAEGASSVPPVAPSRRESEYLFGSGRGGGGRGRSAQVNLSSWRGALYGVRPPRYAVPLACLESDFMSYNRELRPIGAAAAHLACDPVAIADSARLAARLHAQIHAQQNASDVATCHEADEPRVAEKGRAGNALMAVTLHPSGFFSLVHGLLKPLMHAVRTNRVLLTPRSLEFTSEAFVKAPCHHRDLSCFFEPLSPPCDAAERRVGESIAKLKAMRKGEAVAAKGAGKKHGWQMAADRPWPALAGGTERARSEEMIDGEKQAAKRTPEPYRSMGWFWYSSHLLSFLLRPNAPLRADIAKRMALSRLSTAVAAGSLIVGMHVRHGDACRSEEIVRARRTCTPLSEYMAAARRLLAELPAAGGKKARSSRVVVYLATDSVAVLRESKAYADTFDVIHLPKSSISRHDPKDGDQLLWDKRVWQRFFWGQTAWTMGQAWDATTELFLLSHADIFVGKFTSNLFRAAYALRAAQCDCAPLFASLDAPTCFDYGIRAGRNWEFPMANESLTRRGVSDATYEC